MPSTQVPPFLQSTPKQSSKLISQLVPLKPKGQEHWYPATWMGGNDLTSLPFFSYLVSAVAPILARTVGAFIYVDLTGVALKAFQALALVAAGADLREI